MADDLPEDQNEKVDVGETPLSEAEPAESEPQSDAGALVRYDPLQRYLTEIRKYALLSREEEHRLAVRYKEHQDIEAAYRLVTANLRLVVMIAREYQRAFRNLLDLVQEGNIGLMEAVKNFDPYRGIRFPSYAVWWIRAYIIRYIMNNWRMVKIGTTQAQRKLFFNLQKEKDRLEAEGFSAEPKLLAKRLDVKESEVIEMEQRLAGRDLSVDAPVEAGDEASMLDFLPSKEPNAEEEVADAEARELISRKVKAFGETLAGKDKVIFDARLMAEEPLTLQEIGDKYGISRERVRQIEERIKKKLKNYLLAESPDLEDAVVDIIR
ncbi:MAG TPA: RNA polymerase factor sigma-32 [Candidatus Margulisiibacteriota bacterium]|nr:RNA polymerase factor sigma-32 [Candidatus Margulisiibacteriota bacterium]